MKTIRIFILLSAWAFMPGLNAAELIIVYDQLRSYYQPTIDALAQEHSVVALSYKQFVAYEVKPEQILVSFGMAAAKNLALQAKDNSIVSVYITQEDSQKLNPAKNQRFIWLDQPLSRYKKLALTLFPEKSLLIPATPNLLDQYQTVFNEPDFDFLRIDTDDNFIRELRQRLGPEQVVLALPGSGIFQNNYFKAVLLTTYRKRVPLISYSNSHVQSGAVAAVFSSPINVADDVLSCLKTLNSQCKNNRFPEYFEVQLNSRVANSLELNLPAESEIILKLQQELH